MASTERYQKMIQANTEQVHGHGDHPIASALPPLAKLTIYFGFLDRLRKSGATNMFAATPYLEEAFDLKRRSGAPILSAWMKKFSDATPAQRAKLARELK
jgi:hypothetical protein